MTRAVETQTSVRDPRKETWPFAIALFIVVFAGISGFGILLYWAVPAFWPYSLVSFTLDSGEEVLAVDIPFHQRSEVSESQNLALVAGSQGQLAIKPLLESERLRKRAAESAIYIGLEAGSRFVFYPEFFEFGGERTSFEATNSFDLFEEKLIQEREVRRRLAKLQKSTHTEISPERLVAVFEEISELRVESAKNVLFGSAADGNRIEIPIAKIVEYYVQGQSGMLERLRLYLQRVIRFVSDEPRGGTTAGGIFPAIVGTFFLTVVMSIIVAPLGVVVALYLNEYAKEGFLLNWVRTAVNNLAGIPSIIYGVFGLGFFVYFVGGQVDRFFYSDALPSPTFGTGGILWASLALALMTLPVVIVSTEESLRGVPRHVRDASMALGASKWQTVWRVVLPYATPGLLTGLILAVARAAGEVAPLMLLGVTRLAPQGLVSTEPPFLHFEQKFMHLGYHVYDLSFHSSNSIEAVPFIFVSSLLLVGLIFFMNLTAVIARRVLLEQQRKFSRN